jgi:hypothetical protein
MSRAHVRRNTGIRGTGSPVPRRLSPPIACWGGRAGSSVSVGAGSDTNVKVGVSGGTHLAVMRGWPQCPQHPSAPGCELWLWG